MSRAYVVSGWVSWVRSHFCHGYICACERLKCACGELDLAGLFYRLNRVNDDELVRFRGF